MTAARLWPLALCLGLAACSHYQLGTPGKLTFSTLYIEPASNKTLLPQARAILTTQIRQAFIEDGRLQVVNSPQEADATLTVVISEYRRDIAAVRENDTGLASKFSVTFVTICTLRDNRSGQALIDHRTVQVEQGVYTDNGMVRSTTPGDQLQSEYNTLPLLAQAMASKLSHLVLDVW
ncbi:MAG TPA: LPS assembly lipoprotein LptE [Opitutaceae bacterium]|jgi:hypothetical protein|nr:LPS assembly lipoprotein LptE [Opitutaceae bacterium]